MLLHRWKPGAFHCQWSLYRHVRYGFMHRDIGMLCVYAAVEIIVQALNVTRYQQAKSWELRAATSLARPWQQ